MITSASLELLAPPQKLLVASKPLKECSKNSDGYLVVLKAVVAMESGWLRKRNFLALLMEEGNDGWLSGRRYLAGGNTK